MHFVTVNCVCVMICKAYASGNNWKIPNEYALETTVLHIRALISKHFHCTVLGTVHHGFESVSLSLLQYDTVLVIH